MYYSKTTYIDFKRWHAVCYEQLSSRAACQELRAGAAQRVTPARGRGFQPLFGLSPRSAFDTVLYVICCFENREFFMEALFVLLAIALLFALLIVPFIVLAQLSALRRGIKGLENENQQILAHLLRMKKKQEGGAGSPPAAEQTAAAGPPLSALTLPAAAPVIPLPQPLPKPPPLPASAPHSPADSEQRIPAAERSPQSGAQRPPPAAAAPAPAAKLAEQPHSRFAESAQEIFGKIWRWILVGEEYQPKGISTESAVASTWMMRAFVIFVVSAVAYLLKWSIERQFLGPAGRFAIGIGFGIAMLISGIRLIRTRYRMIGEGLLGGGIVVLYLSVYAADVMYQLMPTPLAFALMALVTITAGFLAVRLDSLLVAIFGIIGGYLTPIALSTTVLSLPGFYSYILILSIAVLVIVQQKQWRLLNYLSFILTYGLYFFHSLKNYDKATDFTVAITFLTLLFAVQSLTVCIHNIIRKQLSSIMEAIHLILNAVVYAAGGYFLIAEAHGRPYPALMALGLALFYMLYIVMFLRRGLKDRLLLLCLISLSAAFTAWTLPLIMEKESLTIAFALLAFIFLWLGRGVKSNFLQSLSYLVYGIVFFRVAFMEMPGHYHLSSAAPATWSEYFREILDRLFTFGISIGSIIGAFLLSRRETKESNIIFPENDITPALPAGITSGIMFWASVIFVFIFMNLEVNAMFRCWDPIRLPMLTLLWGGLILFLFRRMLATEKTGGNSDLLFTLTTVILTIALIKLIAFDAQSWNLTSNFIYNREYALLDSSMRLFDFSILTGVILVLWRLISGSRSHARHQAQFGYAGLALFFLYATLELRTLLYWKMQSFMPAGISILWSVFAISFIVFGISRRKGLLRALGLALFVIVCAKITLYDLRGTEIIYRIIALLVIGMTLLLGSFAYLKSNKLGPTGKE